MRRVASCRVVSCRHMCVAVQALASQAKPILLLLLLLLLILLLCFCVGSYAKEGDDDESRPPPTYLAKEQGIRTYVRVYV
ncbi:uncharacterized protein IWZ02DRAFT_456842 [Phyllosticta citriasiana]|uniref:uncharacterized protein n=1 Tax=Phyllosticta citriasiana TaxID=595635 RepID=UPI0030FD3CA3